MIGFQPVEAAVEISDPETSLIVRCESGDVAIAKYRGAGLQDWLPTKGTGAHAVKAAAGEGIFRFTHVEQLTDFAQPSGQLNWGSRGRTRTM